MFLGLSQNEIINKKKCFLNFFYLAKFVIYVEYIFVSIMAVWVVKILLTKSKLSRKIKRLLLRKPLKYNFIKIG